MALLSVSNLGKYFGDELLFSDASFMIEEGEKIGFVGVNGAGKTSLFKMLLSEMSYDDGEIIKNKNLKIGYVKQQMDITSDKTVIEELLTVFDDVIAAEKELEKIAGDISNNKGDVSRLIERQHDLTSYFESRGGYMYKNIAQSSLIGLGFEQSQFNTPFEKLSGGQKTRVLLCKILLSGANLLLLDEPTNHLDIKAVAWLEGFLKDYKGAAIIISHDRYFLDKTTAKTIELENGRLTVYGGNYSRYLELKREAAKVEERAYINTKKEIERIEKIIEQQKRWNREKNIKTAESKQKIVDKLFEKLIKPSDAPEELSFKFSVEQISGNECISCTGLAMAFGIKKIFENLSFSMMRGEKVFLLGENGCGKTTLFKILTGELSALDGEIKEGANLKIGYYDQAQENLDMSKTVFDEIYDAYPELTVTQIRNSLAAFLFKGEDVFKPISLLSGGEKAKVSLLKLMLSGANLLLLDEPTNHLDIKSREALEKAISEYEGTVLAVSHDRYFINKLAQRILYMNESGLANYQGNYDYFLSRFTESEDPKKKTKDESRQSYKEQKAKEAEERKRLNRMAKIEENINTLEEEVEHFKALLETEEYSTDYVKAGEAVSRMEELNDEILKLYEEYDILAGEE